MYKGTYRPPANRATKRFRTGVKRPKILPARGRPDFVVLVVAIVLAIVRTSPDWLKTVRRPIQSSD
jgi:hypothetical protein